MSGLWFPPFRPKLNWSFKGSPVTHPFLGMNLWTLWPKHAPLFPLVGLHALSALYPRNWGILFIPYEGIKCLTLTLIVKSPPCLVRNRLFHGRYVVSSFVVVSGAQPLTLISYLRRINFSTSVDTIHRTYITSYSIASESRRRPIFGTSLSLLDLCLDCGVLLDCWASLEFLHTPIPRTGSGSTNQPRSKFYVCMSSLSTILSLLKLKFVLKQFID